MVISTQLSQENLKEIMLNIYKKGMETEDIYVKDFIKEIIKQMVDEPVVTGENV
ncbi:hypothetical protein [Bacillus pinisoli]|uniref:hypothetical protein n=1 Tax=Bacillus pinisoli TaxID=2901866 RepID=UPI001FF2510A|nr:hypothetical protein [Bacillus pinisoli]